MTSAPRSPNRRDEPGPALWLFVMFRAYQGEEWEMPLIGPCARRLAREATGGA